MPFASLPTSSDKPDHPNANDLASNKFRVLINQKSPTRESGWPEAGLNGRLLGTVFGVNGP